jgi:hypothetical protein
MMPTTPSAMATEAIVAPASGKGGKMKRHIR